MVWAKHVIVPKSLFDSYLIDFKLKKGAAALSSSLVKFADLFYQAASFKRCFHFVRQGISLLHMLL